MKKFLFLLIILNLSFNLKGQILRYNAGINENQLTREYVDSLQTIIIQRGGIMNPETFTKTIDSIDFWEDGYEVTVDTSVFIKLNGEISIKLNSETDLPSCNSLPCYNIPIEIDSLEFSSSVSFFIDYLDSANWLPNKSFKKEIFSRVREFEYRVIRNGQAIGALVRFNGYKINLNKRIPNRRKGDRIFFRIKRVSLVDSNGNVSDFKSYYPKIIYLDIK
tara:strand:- start:1910 stop:2569 length:660 start_codon:yes stop_codon:yes gene_type:complete